jgi:glycosyltransferase involved in cell wall biosynthesis
MKIYIPNQSKQTLGGGFVFISNLKKGILNKGLIVDDWRKSDAVLIVSCTMTDRAEIRAAKDGRKKIILRIDNMPKDSRNRGTAFSRMRDYAEMADTIIFQSEWAKKYVGDWLGFNFNVDINKSKVIYNGIDPEFFYYRDNPEERAEKYIYCSFNTDENKRFPEAAYDFYLRNFEALRQQQTQPELTIVGKFDDKLREYNFDFFNKEKIKFYQPIDDRKRIGDLFRENKYMYFPAFADASPNTVAEGIACGCKILLSNPIGGTQEVMDYHSKNTFTIGNMADKYLESI